MKIIEIDIKKSAAQNNNQQLSYWVLHKDF